MVDTVLPAPAGYVVNFDDPQRSGLPAGYIVTGVGIALAAFFLAMRLYTRIFLTHNFAFDDAALIASWCFGLAVQAILAHLWAVKADGVHAWEMPFDTYQYFSLMIMIASILYVPTLGLAKFSILFLYRRLSTLRWFNYCVYALMGIVISYSIAIVVALIFPCNPIAKNWDLTITEGKCIDKAGIYLATAAVNVITDFMILLLPIPMVLKLQMPRNQKIGLVVVFTVGSATFVTSIVRLVLMVPMVKNIDQTWVVSIPCIWINIEANLVIICCSLPALRNFLKHHFPVFMRDNSAHSGNSSDVPSYLKNKHSNQNTFGSIPISKRGKHSKYGRMTETELEMTGEFGDLKNDNISNTTSEVEEGRRSEGGVMHDDGSEKAIWRTREVTVEYGRAK